VTGVEDVAIREKGWLENSLSQSEGGLKGVRAAVGEGGGSEYRNRPCSTKTNAVCVYTVRTQLYLLVV